jgi:uncharacterized protein YbjT (DUF2867 family)
MSSATPPDRSSPVLVTGATGKTGSRVLERLRSHGRPALGVARSTPVRFDWTDESTHPRVLEGAGAIYLVPPVGVPDPEPVMAPFIDRALEAGVRRFVLLSASVIPEGGPGLGAVHATLRDQAPEWAVLRPSWFMQNFAGDSHTAEDLAEHGVFETSVGDGRVAFVDADDIAAVALHALVDDVPHQRAHVITGPAALSYDEVAATLSRVSGRRLAHRRVDRAAVSRRLRRLGLDEAYADFLAGLEDELRAGVEDRTTDTVQRVTGRPPRSLEAWAAAHAETWKQA